MKLQQLRYLWEVVRHKLNVSATAEELFTSQPGISKQIKLLEDELGVQIFARKGKQLVEVTSPGRTVVEAAGRILAEVENIKRLSRDLNDRQCGSISIATTHTQARYALPSVIQTFMTRYPKVALHMHQGTPMQISELAASRDVDFAIATEALERFENLIMLPCYRWNRSVVTLRDHPLTRIRPLTLEAVAQYPLITYVFGFTGRSQLDRAFSEHGLRPEVILTAVDADVIKTYVKLGLGVGIIASMAYDPQYDETLAVLDAGHLFEPSITKIGFRRGTYLRSYMYEFIELFAPHLTREVIDQAIACRDNFERERMFSALTLPDR